MAAQPVPAADLLAAFLVAQGLAVAAQPAVPDPAVWYVVVGPLPPNGERAVAINPTGGEVGPKVMRADESYQPTCVLIIRGPDDFSGYDYGQQLEAAFAAVGGPAGPVTLVGVRNNNYTLFKAYCYTRTTPLGREQTTRRELFSLNVRLNAALAPGVP
jgi:hypothetical protein